MTASGYRANSSANKAFTLLELAIVLAIVGLMVGGIFGGKKLVQASRLHGVMDDATTYAMAIQQFKEKYGEYPGDFSQATKQWGASVAGDGDGDGKIDTAGEGYLAWQHLAIAGMINGSYTGLSGAAAVPASNIPKGAMANSGYWFGAWGYQAADAVKFYDGDYSNAFLFGGATAASWPSAPVLTGAEAYQIDQKMDDGSPSLGNVRSFNSNLLSNCVADAGGAPAANSASYKITTKTSACVLIFMNTFKAASKF